MYSTIEQCLVVVDSKPNPYHRSGAQPCGVEKAQQQSAGGTTPRPICDCGSSIRLKWANVVVI